MGTDTNKENNNNIPDKNEETERAKSKKNIVKYALLLIALFTVVAATIMVLVPFIQYNKAFKMREEDKYDKALELFARLDDYKDSQDMIMETKYLQADYFVENQEYSEAIILYENIIDYKESVEKLKEAKYFLAGDYLKQGMCDEANDILQEIEPYDDTDMLYPETDYQFAKRYLENKEYTEALRIFRELARNEYKDSDIMVKEAVYQRSMDFEQENNFMSAYNGYIQIIDYKDVEEKLSDLVDSLYEEGVKSYRYGDIYKAAQNFLIARNSRDEDADKYLYLILAQYLDNYDYFSDWEIKAICTDILKVFDIEYSYDYKEGFKLDGDLVFYKLVKNIGFENSVEVLTSDTWVLYFLEGYWSGEGYYMKFWQGEFAEENLERLWKRLWSQDNLPRERISNAYFVIEDGVYILVDNDDKTRTELFKLDIIDENHVNIYCYKNEKTYEMTRKKD